MFFVKTYMLCTVQSFIYYDQQCVVCASLDYFSINMFCFCIVLRVVVVFCQGDYVLPGPRAFLLGGW